MSLVKTVIKIFTTIICIIIAIPIFYILYSKWSHRPLHKPTFYARVNIDMKVDNEVVHMERIITCSTIPETSQSLFNPYGRSSTRPRTKYVSHPRAIGSYLSNGGAIMLWTPYECDREKYLTENGESKIRLKQNTPEYVPRFGWTPDISTLDTLEIYFDHSSYLHPQSRVKDIIIHIELIDEDEAKIAKPDDFNWFSGTVNTREFISIDFVSNYVWSLGEDQWRGFSPVLDSELDSYSKPQMIRASPNGGSTSPSSQAYHLFYNRLGPDLYEEDVPNKNKPKGVYYTNLNNPHHEKGTGLTTGKNKIEHLFTGKNTLTIEHTGVWDRLIMSRSNHMYIKGETLLGFSTHKGIKILNPKGKLPSISTAPILYDGRTILPNTQYRKLKQLIHPSRYMYDPDSKELFSIHLAKYTVYADPKNPIFTSLKNQTNKQSPD